ncbi:hypothetical protein [Microscilla marina]|uniref:Uncharacterized protein n=1 Tax=Microscilla marina ATCC 23134 TaxID=313606 RepID=A1ZL92_MICM2|nr:hypothetical protein [Microscilla marina]EAY28646.1 hypothetical protein M23134_07744 [Microscilla marina ATCC 23134]
MTYSKHINIEQLAETYAPQLINTLQTGKQLNISTPGEVINILLDKIAQGFGKLSARLPQQEIALLYQLLQYQDLQTLEAAAGDEKLMNNEMPYHKITLKNPGIQQGEKYRRLPVHIADGLLIQEQGNHQQPYTGAIKTSLGLPQKISYVIMPNGEVRFGNGHYYLAGNSPIALIGAGVLRARNGKIISIMNDSNHFRPTRMEFIS